MNSRLMSQLEEVRRDSCRFGVHIYKSTDIDLLLVFMVQKQNFTSNDLV